MPRQRQRIVFCDCFDCRDRPEVSLTSQQLDAATAVARQEPPPKALLLLATSFVVAADGETNLDICTLPHLNLIVREGNLGLLAVRPAEALSGLGPAISELAQLLGVYQEVRACQLHPDHGDGGLPSIAARFKGMQGALASTSAAARQLAQRLGMAVVDRLSIGLDRRGTDHTALAAGASAADAATTDADGTAPGTSVAPDAASDAAPDGQGGGQGRTSPLVLPDPASFAEAISAELGAAEGSVGRDLLLLHLDLNDLMRRSTDAFAEFEGAAVIAEGCAATTSTSTAATTAEVVADANAVADLRWDASCESLEWLDSLVKGLLGLPEIRDRTLLVLMLSPGGEKMPAVRGLGGLGGGGNSTLLTPGGVQLDPSAVIVTPRSLAQVGRGGDSTVATATATAALSVLDTPDLPQVTRPLQSFEFLGMARAEVDAHAPVLVARRLPGVVRCDRAERLGYKEALTAGATGAILMERLLPEVAYKIARAPKYGA